MSEEKKTQLEFNIINIYLKDASFEAPHSPHGFQLINPESTISFTMDIQNKQMGDDLYETILKVTVTVKENQKPESKTLYIAEVQQAGLFKAIASSQDHLGQLLHIASPTILFPYVRQMVATLTLQGGFQAFQLQPINFEAQYFANLEKAKASGQTAETLQ